MNSAVVFLLFLLASFEWAYRPDMLLLTCLHLV